MKCSDCALSDARAHPKLAYIGWGECWADWGDSENRADVAICVELGVDRDCEHYKAKEGKECK